MADVEDDQLLGALGVALRTDASAEPSRAELMAFQSVVSSSGRVASAGRGGSARLRRWVAGLLAGGVVLSGGTAYATNPVAPRPVRSAAFALKLPVEAPDLTDAKDALDDLEEELHEGRRDKVAAAVEDVEEELADLSASARGALDPRATSLLAAARAFLADPLTQDEEKGGDDSSSGRGSGSDDSGSGSSGSGGDDSGSDGSDSSGSGSSGSGSGSDDSVSSGSGSSGSGSGSDDSVSSGSGSSGSGGGGGGVSGSSGSGSSGSSDD
jgi:hypothetical protein